jgi:hypothetical protein
MTYKHTTILRNVLRAALAAGLLACVQAHAVTTTENNLSSGLGTLRMLLRYFQFGWF